MTNKQEEEEKEFISILPDQILHKILSFLPTEEALATSAISRLWRHHWKYIHRLHFNDAFIHNKPTPIPNHNPETHFINFVHYVLERVNLGQVISVTLSCLVSYGSKLIDTWLHRACMHGNIVELEVYVNFEKDPISLPPLIYTCNSLVVLKLKGNIKLDHDLYKPCFPSLKVLHIFIQNQQGLNLTQRLYSNCPVLEDLFLESMVLEEREVRFEVCSSTLKRLRIVLAIWNKSSDLNIYSVLIKAKNLKWLSVSNNFIVKYLFQEVNVLDQANVHIGHPSVAYFRDNLAFEFLKALSQLVKSLSLSGCTTNVLWNVLERKLDLDENYGEDHLLSSFTLPDAFTYLTKLELRFRNYRSWNILPNILECSPILESLALEKEILYSSVYEGWREPASLPVCMSSCLKQIRIKGFQRMQFELTVMKFLLRHALVLEKMIIRYPPLPPDEETMLQETIFEYPRGSENCQIIFFSDSSLQL